MRIWRGGDLRGARLEELHHGMQVLPRIPARAVSVVDSWLLEMDIFCSLYTIVILAINEMH